jgi:hypothetical protein
MATTDGVAVTVVPRRFGAAMLFIRFISSDQIDGLFDSASAAEGGTFRGTRVSSMA